MNLDLASLPATPPDAVVRPAVVPVRFASLEEPAELSVILVNYNTGHLLERCVDALRAACHAFPVRLVIVDNASRDGSAAVVRERIPDAVLIDNAHNVGFGRANNQALASCTDSRHILLLNVDAFVHPDTIEKSVRYLDATPRCGVLGVRITGEDGIGWYTGRRFPDPWADFALRTGLRREARELMPPIGARPADGSPTWVCDWVVGCYYMVRREVLDKVGLFDPRYFLYFEEVDHCRAVRDAGWTVECLADARVIHIGGASAASEGELTSAGRQISALQTESELLYYRKHDGLPGLVRTVVLGLAVNAIGALKWMLKGRGWGGLKVYGREMATLVRLAARTRLGTRPTR